MEGESLEVSLSRRQNDLGETLLVFNESWGQHRARLRFVRGGQQLSLWNPATGSHRVLRHRVEVGEVVRLDLDPAETLLLTLRNAQGSNRKSPGIRVRKSKD